MSEANIVLGLAAWCNIESFCPTLRWGEHPPKGKLLNELRELCSFCRSEALGGMKFSMYLRLGWCNEGGWGEFCCFIRDGSR